MPGYEIIGEEEKEEILDVLSRKMLFRYEFNNEREGIYKVEEFEKEAENMGTKVEIISTETQEGVQLRDLGKVAAVLRYEIKG